MLAEVGRRGEARIKQVEHQLEAIAEQLPAVAQLRTIPGVGLLVATALIAFHRRHPALSFGPPLR